MLADQGWQTIFEMPQVAITATMMMACVIAVAGIVAYYWHLNQKTHAEVELKHTMIERGMSADEIERVLAAQIGTPRRPQRH